MQATEFEFRHRFWVILAVFAAGFACYSLDHRNSAYALAGGSRAGARVVLAAGALLVIAAAALRTWASAYLRTLVVKDQRLHADRLVADGPYRYLRNPLYLGTVALAVCFGLMASRLGFLVIVGGMLLVVYRLIGREEAALSRSQGSAYDAYRARVPRLWPALRPRVSASGTRPEWRQAFTGELMMWGFALAAATFAVTLDRRLFYAFLVLGFIGYLPGVRTIIAPSRSQP
ncbi:MAG: methyltransferase family protein [Gemmatimonadota bacterium]